MRGLPFRTLGQWTLEKGTVCFCVEAGFGPSNPAFSRQDADFSRCSLVVNRQDAAVQCTVSLSNPAANRQDAGFYLTNTAGNKLSKNVDESKQDENSSPADLAPDIRVKASVPSQQPHPIQPDVRVPLSQGIMFYTYPTELHKRL